MDTARSPSDSRISQTRLRAAGARAAATADGAAHRGRVLRGRVAAFCALLAFLFIAGVAIWYVSAEHRALLDMPERHRVALYRETLRHTEVICAQATVEPWLLGRCRASAEFLRWFPECDRACFAFTGEYTASRVVR